MNLRDIGILLGHPHPHPNPHPNQVLELAAQLLTSARPSGAPSARVGLLYESSQGGVSGATRAQPGSRAATVLRYTTLAVPLQEPLPPDASLPPHPPPAGGAGRSRSPLETRTALDDDVRDRARISSKD